MAAPGLVKRVLRRARGSWRDQAARTNVAVSRWQRGLRLAAVRSGVALPEVARLECRRGADVSGLFSEFAAVVGMLDHFERWRHLYRGLRVIFADGLYFDSTVGPNWWEYYFAPIDIGGGSPERVVSPHFHDLCAHRVERGMPRDTGAGLVARYVTPSATVQDHVDGYLRAHWSGHRVAAVHYRGTDKADDAPRVPYEHVAAVVQDELVRGGHDRLFVATDEQAFVDFIRCRFPDRVLCRDLFRSIDGRPIDVVNADGNYQKGLDAVVDCLLLARAATLVRTASNLSLCATLFNPRVPVILLNEER